MVDSKYHGTHGVVVRNPHKPDWPTDGQEHVFGASPHGSVTLIVTKLKDGRLRVELFDAFDETFVFTIPSQPNTFQTNGVYIKCEWSDGEVRLFANNQLVATQRTRA